MIRLCLPRSRLRKSFDPLRLEGRVPKVRAADGHSNERVSVIVEMGLVVVAMCFAPERGPERRNYTSIGT